MAENKRKSPADKLAEKGHARLAAGDYEQALKCFSEAAALFKQDSNLNGQAAQLQIVAEIYRQTERIDLALETYSELVGLYDRLNAEDQKVEVLSTMGFFSAMQHSYLKALSFFQQALEISKRLGDERYMAQQLGNIGSSYRELNENESALESYRQALPLYRKLGHGEGAADQCTNIAYILVRTDRIKEALSWYRKALPLYKKAESREKFDLTKQNIEHLKNHPGLIKNEGT